MGIKIDTVGSTLPKTVFLTLVCDDALCTACETWKGDHYPVLMREALAAGWKESAEHTFLCPQHSGKKVMNAITLPPWSYSFLSGYQNCPFQTFCRYIAKTAVFMESAAQKWGNDVHDAMNLRITAGKPLKPEMVKWENWGKAFVGLPVRGEERVGVRADGTPCGFYDPDCAGHMKIDLVYEPGDHTARLFDWKTGKVREDDFELRLQALFVQARNPELRHIYGWYVWLAEGAHGTLGAKHDLSDVDRTWAEVDSMMNTIKNNAAINHWPKREGPLCKYCNVPKAQCEYNRNPDMK